MVLIKPRSHVLANTKVRLEHLVTEEWEKQLLSSYKKWGLKLLRELLKFFFPQIHSSRVCKNWPENVLTLFPAILGVTCQSHLFSHLLPPSSYQQHVCGSSPFSSLGVRASVPCRPECIQS